MARQDREPRRPSTALLLAQRIVRDSARQGLHVGDVLPTEHDMTEHYRTGRSSVREALRLLELEGVVAFRHGPRSGPILVEPNAGHLADTLAMLMQLSNSPFRSVVEVRSAVEPMIARLAAARLDDGALAALRANVGLMRGPSFADGSFWENDKRFHRLVATASGNPLLALVVDSLLGIMDGAAVGTGYPENRRQEILDAHIAILDALEGRDPAAASERMLEHIRGYERYAESSFPELLIETVTWEPRPLET